MVDQKLLALILDSLKEPVLFADTSHITRYMNKAAVAFYDGGADLIGRSLMDCHNENSRKMLRELLIDLQGSSDDERLFSTKDKEKVYIRAVRDGKGKLLGYYERYEKPPQEG